MKGFEMPPNMNNWNEYKRYVIKTLDDHSKNFTEIFNRLGKIEVEIAKLKIRAGFFGLIGAMIPILIMLAIIIIRTKLK